MTTFLSTIETRIVDVLENARGQSGLGATAALRYIPTGRFRRTKENAPIDDPGLSIELFDRSYDLSWLSIAQVDEPHNQYDGFTQYIVRFLLRIGYVYGSAISQFSTTTGSESANTNVLTVKRRALEDIRRIERALCFPDIYQSTSDNPSIANLQWFGETSFLDLGGGKLVMSCGFRTDLYGDNNANFDP